MNTGITYPKTNNPQSMKLEGLYVVISNGGIMRPFSKSRQLQRFIRGFFEGQITLRFTCFLLKFDKFPAVLKGLLSSFSEESGPKGWPSRVVTLAGIAGFVFYFFRARSKLQARK